MTSTEFIQLGQKIVGCKRGYQPLLAFRLQICLRTVKRYASGTRKIPPCIVELMRLLDESEHPYINY